MPIKIDITFLQNVVKFLDDKDTEARYISLELIDQIKYRGFGIYSKVLRLYHWRYTIPGYEMRRRINNLIFPTILLLPFNKNMQYMMTLLDMIRKERDEIELTAKTWQQLISAHTNSSVHT